MNQLKFNGETINSFDEILTYLRYKSLLEEFYILNWCIQTGDKTQSTQDMLNEVKAEIQDMLNKVKAEIKEFYNE